MPRVWLFSLALLTLTVPQLSRAEGPPTRFGVEAVKDVAYYDGPGAHKVKHRLDLYLPRGQKDFPVLFFVHGGAWQRGDKAMLGVYSALGSFYARHGVGAVVINYRLSPAVQHPEHVKDVARAFAWTHKNIARYGGRPDRIFVCGHSAGGHLIALLATDESYLKAEGLSTKAIRGAIALSGVYRIPDRYLASVFGTDPEVRKQASPIEHARAGLPPFLIIYGDSDYPDCGREPSEAFAKALKDKGDRVETLEVKDCNHYSVYLNTALPDSPVSRAILAFIAAHSGDK
jgi:acetyl esterase/lipase